MDDADETAAPRRWWQRSAAEAVPSALHAAAAERGWPVREGDTELAAVIAGSPLRLGLEYEAATVVRGSVRSFELVAFDVVYRMPRGELTRPKYAMTSVPVPIPLPALRVAPRRFLTHGAGGFLVLPTGDATFDARFQVLAMEDSPEIRGLVGEPLRLALLAGLDLDEMWTAAGHLVVSRVDAHGGSLLDEHSGVLAAAMQGLQAAL